MKNPFIFGIRYVRFSVEMLALGIIMGIFFVFWYMEGEKNKVEKERQISGLQILHTVLDVIDIRSAGQILVIGSFMRPPFWGGSNSWLNSNTAEL